MQQYKDYRLNNRHSVWAKDTICGHRRNGYDVAISTEELTRMAKLAITCPICGTVLNWDTGNICQQSNSPSLDRINNEPVVAPSNVWIICWGCNRMKGSKTFVEFVKYCKLVAEQYEIPEVSQAVN